MAKRRACIRALSSLPWVWVSSLIHNHPAWNWCEELLEKGLEKAFPGALPLYLGPSSQPGLSPCLCLSVVPLIWTQSLTHELASHPWPWPVPVFISMALPGHPGWEDPGSPHQTWSWPPHQAHPHPQGGAQWLGLRLRLLQCPPGCQVLPWRTMGGLWPRRHLTALLFLIHKHTVCPVLHNKSLQSEGTFLKSTMQLKQ